MLAISTVHLKTHKHLTIFLHYTVLIRWVNSTVSDVQLDLDGHLQLRHQEVGQQEAAEVVHLHHRLLPVLSHLAGGQEGHASVVHQNVKFRLLR